MNVYIPFLVWLRDNYRLISLSNFANEYITGSGRLVYVPVIRKGSSVFTVQRNGKVLFLETHSFSLWLSTGNTTVDTIILYTA